MKNIIKELTLLELIDEIQNHKEAIVVSNNSFINELMIEIAKLKKLIKINYKSFNDVVRDILEGHDNIDRIKLSKSDDLSVSLADIKLKNSLLINDEFLSNKIADLLEIKSTFFNISNELIIDFYKNKTIFVVNDYEDNDYFNIALDLINTDVLKYKIIKKESRKLVIYKFDNIKEEVNYLVREVAQLLESGVTPENIKVHEVGSDYLSYLKEAFLVSNIDLSIDSRTSLVEYELTKKFLNNLYNYLDLECSEGFSKSLEKVQANETSDVYKSLINVLNKYLVLSYKISEIIEDLKYTLKNTSVRNKEYTSVIKVSSLLNSIIKDDDHVFILGFNQDVIPRIINDDDYLSDYEKLKLGLLSSKDKNRQQKQKLLDFIESIKNLKISYPKTINGTDVTISSIYHSLKANNQVSIEEYVVNNKITYSRNLSLLKLGKALDNYSKYKEVSSDLFMLYNSFRDNNYKDYSNKFTGIDQFVLNEFLQKPLYLSYTTIDTYYNCSFVYYLEKVLRIRRSGNTDAIFIGNLFHDVLNQILLKTDIAYLDDFLDAAINNFLIGIDKTPNAKEKFFIGIYKDILIRLRNYISYTENNSDFEILGLEKEYQVVLRKLSPADIDVEVVINGKIDKVLSYKFGTSDYAVVIDYKTGNVDFDLNRIIHGLNMQIIFYFYFLNSNSEEFKFGGGYLEKVLPNNVFDSETNKTFDEQFNKFFKLNGYSNSNHNVLKAIDHNFEDDSFLNGIKLTKSGEFHSYSKNRVISDEEFEGLLNVGRNKIDEAINDIIKGKFDINPKKLGSIDSCRFCPYQDICYKENSDYQELKEYKGFSFLGEEE